MDRVIWNRSEQIFKKVQPPFLYFWLPIPLFPLTNILKWCILAVMYHILWTNDTLPKSVGRKHWPGLNVVDWRQLETTHDLRDKPPVIERTGRQDIGGLSGLSLTRNWEGQASSWPRRDGECERCTSLSSRWLPPLLHASPGFRPCPPIQPGLPLIHLDFFCKTQNCDAAVKMPKIFLPTSWARWWAQQRHRWPGSSPTLWGRPGQRPLSLPLLSSLGWSGLSLQYLGWAGKILLIQSDVKFFPMFFGECKFSFVL